MPISITIEDNLAARLGALAAEAGLPVEVLVERTLQGLVEADIEIGMVSRCSACHPTRRS